MSQRQLITILGSTGSVGVNTLKVISGHKERYSVFALTANSNDELMADQCLEFFPDVAVMNDDAAAQRLRTRLENTPCRTEVLSGLLAIEEVASSAEVDTVMAAIVGGVGLLPTLGAAKAGKKILLANKEALVMAGSLFVKEVQNSGATVLPIDSEHNAIFQCLPINSAGQFESLPATGFEKIVLTASGGPFLNSAIEDMHAITPEQACKHPNWSMGKKISVDSATLLNKSLELIEACYLFNVEEKLVDIVIHPQSIVHSMVNYIDGSVLAQLGNPDMRTPIAYGLAWPSRIESSVHRLDLCEIGRLDFMKPDLVKFPCLNLGRQAAKERGIAPIVLNSSNEEAVQAFLDGRISFDRIPDIIGSTLEAMSRDSHGSADELEVIVDVDKRARSWAIQEISAH